MNKCRLCQQPNTTLIKIYNNRIKSLAEIVLKLKGFKVSLDFNEALAICESCKQGIENVATFWENIPEAKTDNINEINKLEELEDKKPVVLSKKEHYSLSKCDFPTIIPAEQYDHELACNIVETKFEPIKIRIKLPKKRKIRDKPISTISPGELVEKRIRNPPKRFENYILTSPNRIISSNKENTVESNISHESLDNFPPVAILRLPNGQEIGKLIELKSKGNFLRMRIVCEICCQVFSFENQFQKHLKVHSNNKQLEEGEDFMEKYSFHCKLCEKSFDEQYFVRHHLRYAHSEERPFKCRYCEANFKHKFNLSYHMAKHVPKKRFECVFCKKMFLMRYELQIHLRTHTKEKPYKCEFCSFAAAHRSNLKVHQKVKHLNNLANKNVNGERKMSVEKQKLAFKPLENLIEKEAENQHNINDKNISNEPSPTFEEFAEGLNSDKIDTKPTATEITGPEADLACNNNNQILKLSSRSNESYKESFKATLGKFQLDSSILKVLPSATLLGLKKWPKSYQVTPSNPSTSSTFLNIEKSRQHEIGNSTKIANSGNRGVYFLNDEESENASKNKADTIKSVINYKPLQDTFNESSEKISHDICDSSHLHEISNTSITNLKITNFEVSSGGKFINISELPILSTGLNTKHSNGTDQVENKDNNFESTENMLHQPSNCDLPKSDDSQAFKVLKISAKPVKIKNILNLKTSATNYSFSNTTADYITKSSKEAVAKYNNNLSETKLDCLTNTPGSSSSSKHISTCSNVATQSLLKPNLRRKQITTASSTSPNKNQAILPCKPLITNVEILPPLKIHPTLQKSNFATAPISLIKPPIDYKYQCPYCYKYFKQKSSLTKHIRTHTGEKPYKCNLCPKSYADASNYKKHKILHKNAAEALNITTTSGHAIQNSPAYSTVSDPDPDGYEVLQSIKKFEIFSPEDEDDVSDDDDASLTSSTIESHMWHEALEHALKSDEIRESIKRNFANINNAIMPKSMQQLAIPTNLNKRFSTEDPD